MTPRPSLECEGSPHIVTFQVRMLLSACLPPLPVNLTVRIQTHHDLANHETVASALC